MIDAFDIWWFFYGIHRFPSIFFFFTIRFFFSNSINTNKFFKRIISYFTQEQESGFFLVQKIKFCSLKKFFLLGSDGRVMNQPLAGSLFILFIFDLWSYEYYFFPFSSSSSLSRPLELSFVVSWLFSVAIKSFSVIFFFLLAFVNNQRYEIDFLTPGDAPRLPDLVCALWNWLIPIASPWPFFYHLPSNQTFLFSLRKKKRTISSSSLHLSLILAIKIEKKNDFVSLCLDFCLDFGLDFCLDHCLDYCLDFCLREITLSYTNGYVYPFNSTRKWLSKIL